jgi:hypothetical protein
MLTIKLITYSLIQQKYYNAYIAADYHSLYNIGLLFFMLHLKKK